MKVEKQNQKLHSGLSTSLILSLLSPLKSFLNFPNCLTSFECFHIRIACHEVTLHNPALPRRAQVSIKLTDSRVITVSTEIRIIQCFQEWSVYNFLQKLTSKAARLARKTRWLHHRDCKGAKQGWKLATQREMQTKGFWQKHGLYLHKVPGFKVFAFYQLREICYFVSSTNSF